MQLSGEKLQEASTEAQSVLALSPEDVQRLLSDRTSQTRLDMTKKIASVYSASRLTDRETKIAEQIFRLLMRDTERRVRASLAEYIKDSKQIPRDIVMTMARDVEEVSLPVLQFSEVLTDEDLVAIIQSTEQVSRYLAISRRSRVSAVVSGQLIEKGDETVIGTLVENTGALITEASYDKLMNTYRSNETIMRRLADRPHVPLATVDKLLNVVSSNMAETLKRKYQLPGGQIDQEIDKTRETETLSLVRMADDDDVDQLVHQLHLSGRLTPAIVLGALCQGNIEFFETGIAKLAHVPAPNARKLLRDRGELGLRGIYNQSGLSEAMFPAVKLLLSIVRDLNDEGALSGTSSYANRLVERLLMQANGEPVDNLSYIIALVRRSGQN